MKTLQESLFDSDIEKQDVETGELYKLSDVAHYNSFSNDPLIIVNLFKYKELKKWTCKFVDSDNNFIDYWEKRQGILGLAALIDIILQAPAQTFTDPNNVVCEKALKNYLKPYVKPSDYNDLFIGIRRFNMHGDKQAMIEIHIWDNIKNNQPNSIQIMLVRK